MSKGATSMSARGQLISARSRSVAASPPLPIWEMAAGILILFLIIRVHVGAFVAGGVGPAAKEATEEQVGAATKGAGGTAVPVLVTPGGRRAGALRLRSEPAALASEASGQRGNPIVRAH